MIHDLVYRTLLKFKQKPNKELYYNNVKEETDEFFERMDGLIERLLDYIS